MNFTWDYDLPQKLGCVEGERLCMNSDPSQMEAGSSRCRGQLDRRDTCCLQLHSGVTEVGNNEFNIPK